MGQRTSGRSKKKASNPYEYGASDVQRLGGIDPDVAYGILERLDRIIDAVGGEPAEPVPFDWILRATSIVDEQYKEPGEDEDDEREYDDVEIVF